MLMLVLVLFHNLQFLLPVLLRKPNLVADSHLYNPNYYKDHYILMKLFL